MEQPNYLLYLDEQNWVQHCRQWIPISSALRSELAGGSYARLTNTTYGRTTQMSRQQWAQGDSGITQWNYSRTSVEVTPWTAAVVAIRDLLVHESCLYFDSCLVNLYADGSESIPAHGDKFNYGPGMAVATVSIGATRRFKLIEASTKRVVQDLDLQEGDLVLMYGERIQREFHHEIPKQLRILDPRWSLTYRLIAPERLSTQGLGLLGVQTPNSSDLETIRRASLRATGYNFEQSRYHQT